MTGCSPGPSYEEVQDEICESGYRDCLDKELRHTATQRIITTRLHARVAFKKYETALWEERKAIQARELMARVFIPQWVEYLNACKEAGYCLHCDKDLAQCKCVAWA